MLIGNRRPTMHSGLPSERAASADLIARCVAPMVDLILKFLAIQSMTAECEKLFSSAGRLLDESRSRLGITTVAISRNLRSWSGAGMIRGIDPIFLPITEVERRASKQLGTRERAREPRGSCDRHILPINLARWASAKALGVISEAAGHMALKKDFEKGEWITALERVGCDRVALPPLVILKGADVQSRWFPGQNRHLWDEWHSKHRLEGGPVIPRPWVGSKTSLFLIYGLATATNGLSWSVVAMNRIRTMTFCGCLSNRVWLVFYESHCSHVGQVLDVGVFELLKRRLMGLLRECPNGPWTKAY